MQEENIRKIPKAKIFFSRVKRKILKHTLILRFSILLLGAFLIILVIYFCGLLFLRRTQVPLYLSLVNSFLFAPESKIESIGDRTNILVLCKNGQGNDSPDLTDNIIFVSINHKNPRITMISLPRDIWVSELRAKLNSVYFWGNKKGEKGGLILAKAVVEEILGEPVQYGTVIDFKGFIKIIDLLGGIEVDVERSFIDEKYPILGRENDECEGDPEFRCRYETIVFSQGKQVMDGELALKFVRSRNAQGDEGTDFARTKRQQKVIIAIRNRILSKEIILSPRKLLALVISLHKNSETDIPPDGFAIIVRRILQAKENIKSYILAENFFISSPKSSQRDNLYVLIPRDESWNEIHTWVKGVFLIE